MKALVIDDSRVMRRLIVNMLDGIGYETAEAGDGEQAITALEEDSGFALACIDWNMPIMDGLEFVTTVRARPEWNSLTLLMVTTESQQDQIVRALDAGVHEYLMKPFTLDALATKLDMLGLLPDKETA